MKKNFLFAAAALFLVFGCKSKMEEHKSQANYPMETKAFGILPDGRTNTLFTVSNKNGMTMSVMNYGGIIVSLTAPDRTGKMEDVVLGYDSLNSYLQDNPYFGALIGRYGNRIAKGKFALDGETYTLALNNGQNTLHGGVKGFDKVFWKIEPASTKDGASLKLTYTSADGEEGYPGKLDVVVTYTLTDDNQLKIHYRATTDRKTVVNLTQHTYFNLNGATSPIVDHELMIKADRFLPVDSTLIPTGEFLPVSNTPFDFQTPARIGSRINESHEQLKHGIGYDHCWVLNKINGELSLAAVLYDSSSGRQVEVLTTEPGIQFYSGNFLNGSNIGKNGVAYQWRYGLCLETQHFPDSPNRPQFPSTVLNPGEVYESQTIYKFGIR